MKSVLLMLLLLASHGVAASYTLETLVEDSAAHIAPAAIQQAMAQIEKTRLRQCAEAHGIGEDALHRYFSAIPIDLGDQTRVTYLVFPSRYAAAFFGAHAISYWFLERKSDGNFRHLFSGSSDRIVMLSRRSKGLFEIDSFYGESVDRLRFDGRAYQIAER